MIELLRFVLAVLVSPFKPKARLEAENVALRHQLIVLRRKMPGRPLLTNNDRWFFIQLYRWFPSILHVLTIIRPETLVRWHRAGFRCYWRWKSRSLGGRPQIETDLRALIRRMSVENPLWGASRIHGELLKLGFEVAQSSVAKSMIKRRGPPGQGWRTFLRNHAPDIAAMDLFVVPTIGFDLLYAFVIVRLDRRDLVWINVTTNLTAEWIARQLTEASFLGTRGATRRRPSRPRSLAIPWPRGRYHRNNLGMRLIGWSAVRARISRRYPVQSPRIYELVEDHRGNAYRTIYMARVGERVHVLHAFRKKSKSGVKTPREDVELVEARLKGVLEYYRNERDR